MSAIVSINSQILISLPVPILIGSGPMFFSIDNLIASAQSSAKRNSLDA